MIQSYAISSGKAAGSTGVATANATTPFILRGKVVQLYVKYNDSPPATTDVTIETVGAGALPGATILTLTDANTDGVFIPHRNVCNTSGAVQAAVWTPFYIADKVKVTIAQANSGDSVDVVLMIEQ